MPFLALRFQALGVRDTRDVALWTGVTLGVTPAVAAACAPLWGRVGDRFGNKLLVQRSLFSCVFVMTLMGLATQPWQLFALRALQGLVAGYGPLTIAMAAESAPRDRMAHAIGLVQTAQRVAPAVGPVVGGILAQAVGLRNSFFVAGAVYALAFALVSVLYRETAPARPGPRRARARADARDPLDPQPAAADGRDLRTAADRAQPRPGAAAARRVARLRARGGARRRAVLAAVGGGRARAPDCGQRAGPRAGAPRHRDGHRGGRAGAGVCSRCRAPPGR